MKIKTAIAISDRKLPGNQRGEVGQSMVIISGLEEGSFRERIVRHLFMDDNKRIHRFAAGRERATLTMEGLTYPEAERIKREAEQMLEEEGGEIDTDRHS